MGYPSILHKIENKVHSKKFVKDEGEMNDAYAAGFKDSPADFSPEALKAQKEAEAEKKVADELAAKAKARAEKAEALLVKQEAEEKKIKK
jgi:hypothetical protein